MRVDVCLFALLGIANASALIPRDPQEYSSVEPAGYPEEEPDYDTPDYKEPESAYAPKAHYPDKPEEYQEPESAYAPKAHYPDKPEEYQEPEYKEPEYASKAEYPEKHNDYEPEYPEKPDYAPKGDYPEEVDSYKEPEYDQGYKPKKPWKPKTHHPEFFSLKVDQDRRCTSQLEEERGSADACEIGGFAIRLEKGVVIATPYNKWWDPKLPIFFVDDDTQTYTVSKKPLQLYVDSVTGALKYAPVGWLPPNSVSLSFYKTGNNPMGRIGPSPAYFSWPTTEGRANNYQGGVWWFCPISSTGQYQVFISSVNFGQSGQGGLLKDGCKQQSLAAINANPWKKSGSY